MLLTALGMIEVDIEHRAKWYAFIRFLLLLAIAIPGLLALYALEGFSQRTRLDIAITLVALSSNLLFYALQQFRKAPRYLTYLSMGWVILDIALIGLFVSSNVSSANDGRILFIVPILISAALFGRAGLYASTVLSIATYLGVTSVYLDTTSLHTSSVIVSLFFPTVLIVVAVTIDFITKLLRDKQHEVAGTVTALEAAQQVAKVGSWEWDIASDKISWSKQMYRIYGLEPSNTVMTYKQYLSLNRSDRQAEAHQVIIANAMKHRSGFVVDHQITLPGGETKFLHGEGRPWKSQDGTVYKMTGTTQDITDIQNLDTAKREFVSMASHQLRTPASGVKAFLSLLNDGYAGTLSKSQQKFVKQANDANDRQLEVIDNLLSLASIESGKLTIRREHLDIRDIVLRSIRDHTHQSKDKGQRITYKNPTRELTASFDPIAFQMVLDNLLSNAIKYSPEKSSVRVTLSLERGNIRIDIADQGIGISKKNIPLLFQKFSRIHDPASKTVGGSGLGLYTAKHIVELHGGKIIVKSSKSSGSVFTVKLPTSKKSAIVKAET